MYATFERVPVVLMLVPLNSNPVVALIVPVNERFPTVPASTSVRRVFASPSLTVRVLSTPAVPRTAVGAALVSESGEAPESVTVPFAVIFVAPVIAPVLVMPPELLLIHPVIDAPPAETVRSPPIV